MLVPERRLARANGMMQTIWSLSSILAPAVAALALLMIAGQTKRHIAEVLSGILFGITFQVKLVNVILLQLAALITIVAILSVIVWFDRRCLADLTQTSDRDLR